MWRTLTACLVCCTAPALALADQAGDGKALLENNCGRCHAVTAGAESAIPRAPNLTIVLQSYPRERLEKELAEGIRPRHPDMPQVRFSGPEIDAIYFYLHGQSPAAEERQQQ
jgi:mono/diheme cytochrome c family protein